MPRKKTAKPAPDTIVVGIGASAGGLEAEKPGEGATVITRWPETIARAEAAL